MLDEVNKQHTSSLCLTMAVTARVTVVLGVVAGALALVWIRWRKSHTRRLISKVPGPAPAPLFGNVLQIPNTPEGMSYD